ncbi:hypothetical protein C7974DRAFT_399939 [Boeremia exigua]|uniref:uncharacterized protein n=1 Tax=Boeremia exigua TaxID=749465 RepID=UPI001E8E5F53|nr:uncharacterized protein C7974DRAFT_399939 [Boeremia exigua]KAH6620526.1 hypothetical protein C7974DRAFT_399939 [Boeremia exigua]
MRRRAFIDKPTSSFTNQLGPMLPITRTTISNDSGVDASKGNMPIRGICCVRRVECASATTSRRAYRVRHSTCCSSRRTCSSEQDFFTAPSTRYPSTRQDRQDKGKSNVVKSVHAVEPLNGDEHGHIKWYKSIGIRSTSPEHEEQQGRDTPVTRSARRLEPVSVGRSQPAATAIGYQQRAMPVKKREGIISPGTYRSVDITSTSGTVSGRLASQDNVAKKSSKHGRKEQLRSIPPVPIAEVSASSWDISSRLSSRSRSCVFSDHIKAVDGGGDDVTPPSRRSIGGSRKSHSFDAGLHGVEAFGGQRYVAARRSKMWTDSKCEDISRLRTDNKALRKQIADLRNEFRALKDVLLHAESQRRWQDCVS